MDLLRILQEAQNRAAGALDRVRGWISGRGNGSAAGRLVGRVVTRIRSLWSNNITSTETLGQTLNRQDNWYMWQFGATEKHCKDCARFNGQIHRASEWRAAGIRPQSPDLECGGFNCDCRLIPVPGYTGQGEGRMDYWIS